MSIKIGGFNGNNFDQNSIQGLEGRFLETIHKLTFSGSYSTGGDTLDFTNGGVNSAVPPAQSQGIVSINVVANGPASSVSSNGGNYQAQKGTTLANGKLKVFSTAGTELSAGAYPSGVTTDVVYLLVKWAR